MEEINKKLDEFFENATKVQKKLEENQGKSTEQIDKLADAASKTLEEIQDIKQKQEASEKIQKDIEKKLYEMPGSKPIEDNTIKNEMSSYLRKNTPLSQESVFKIAEGIVNSSFHGITNEEKVAIIKSLTVGVDPQIGYLVRPELSNRVLQRLYESSAIRSIATIESTSSDVLEFVIDDNEFSSGGWVGEVQTRSDTNEAEIGIVKIPAHEQYSQPKATQKLLDDASFDIESWVLRKLTDKLLRTENTSFVSGAGANEPKGLLSYAAWTTPGTYERNKIEQRTSSISASFDTNDLIDLQTDLLEFYQPNAHWIMSRKTFAEVMKQKDGTGNYLLNLLMMMKEGTDFTLLGKPVTFASDMPAAASNSLSIAYGDFRAGYTIVDRFGIRVIRDIYTDKPFIKFYTTKRTGGAVTNFDAIKILKLKA